MSRFCGLMGWLTGAAGSGLAGLTSNLKGWRQGLPPLAMLGIAGWLWRPRGAAALGAAAGRSSSGGSGGAPAPRRAVLVKNGEVVEPTIDKSELLNKYSGAYTTARTVDQTRVFEFSFHCKRLHDTAKAVWSQRLEEGGGEATAAACRQGLRFLQEGGAAALKPLLRQEMRCALAHLNLEDDAALEFQITVLMTVDTVGADPFAGRGFDTFTFVQPMPTTTPMVDVLALRADRSNPTIKDAGWVRARGGLEAKQKEAGVNEALMFDAEHRVTEGLQTNLFAVAADGTLLTAPDELVLSGTVRKLVLEVAEQHGLRLRFECPDIRHLADWDSCFICSTSRLVKPIVSVEVPELGQRRAFPTEGSVAHRVEALVLEAFRSHAEPLGGDD